LLGRVEADTTLAGTAADPKVIAEGVETTDQNQLLADLQGVGVHDDAKCER
jgi:hypothetical protein